VLTHDVVSTIDSAAFRNALSQYPTGVAVVTTACRGRRFGLTISSFASVSLDPPLILWSIRRSTASFEIFREAEFFCVNVLAECQEPVARHFATPHADKFVGIPHTLHATGVPMLTDCAVQLVCRNWNAFDGGDHVILVGEVVDLSTSGHRPLVFAEHRFQRLPQAAC
jgi:4-hydroxyphenylacetate 3-hydroxylase, reductase component